VVGWHSIEAANKKARENIRLFTVSFRQSGVRESE
jgi:hypothetical protein